MLVLLTPNQVEVHSAAKMPQREQTQVPDEALSSLIPNLGTIADALEISRFVRSVETGQFFQEHADSFPPNETVDRCLLKILVHTSHRLRAAGWDLPRAHALLGRVLFVSLLHERKFIQPDYYPDGTTCLLDILKRPGVEETKRLLYQEFFPRLRAEFNGTMFDTALADEEHDIREVHLDALAHFLSAHDVKSGQMTLGFWAYDFRFIPVEIISAIYEEFMKDANPIRKRSEGAYYTPRHLAETTLHIALEGRYADVIRWRILDPALRFRHFPGRNVQLACRTMAKAELNPRPADEGSGTVGHSARADSGGGPKRRRLPHHSLQSLSCPIRETATDRRRSVQARGPPRPIPTRSCLERQ